MYILRGVNISVHLLQYAEKRYISNIMCRKISEMTVSYTHLGSPVGHSGSPAMYNFSFRYHNLDYAYMAFDIKEDQVPAALDVKRHVSIIKRCV